MDSWRASESGQSLQSGRQPSESPSLSTERHQMQQQLAHVKASLNALALLSPGPGAVLSPGPGISMQHGTSMALGLQASSPPTPHVQLGITSGLEKLLEDVVGRLNGIEGMYGDVSSKLARNERSVRELQHISAGAMNETARLVDLVGTGSRSAAAASLLGTGPHPFNTPPRTSRHQAPQPSSRTAVAVLDYAPQPPNPFTTTIHQHASLLHKLSAGLDFLEQHMINTDQVIESVQKQLSLVVHEQGSVVVMHAPNELAIQVHDVSEVVNKLRAHMYKVEKKTSASEAHAQHVNSRMEAFMGRLEALEQRDLQTLGAISNPLFSSPEEANMHTPQRRPSTSTRVGVDAELRAEVAELTLELGAVRDEVSVLRVKPAATSAVQAADVEAQLQALRAQHAAASATQAAELATLRRQLSAVMDTVDERVEGAQRMAAATAARAAALAAAAAVSEPTLPDSYAQVLGQLQAGMEALSGRVEGSSSVLDARVERQEQELYALRVLVAETQAQRSGASEGLAQASESLAARLERQEQELFALQLLCTEANAQRTSEGLAQAVMQGAIGFQVDRVKEELAQVARTLQTDLGQLAEGIAYEQVQIGSKLQEQMDDLGVKQAVDRASLQAMLAGVDEQSTVLRAHIEEVVTGAEERAQVISSLLASELATSQQSAQHGLVAVSGVVEDLAGSVASLGAALGAVTSRLGDVATHVQVEGVVQVVEELQSTCRDTVAGLENLRATMSRDYINHEKLGAIFAAREDMRAALSKMEHVFSGGHPGTQVQEAQEAAQLAASRLAAVSPPPPRVDTQVDQLEDKVAGTQSTLAEVQSQLALLQYRWEGSARQEQLNLLQQSLIALEIHVRDTAAARPALPASGRQTASHSVVEEGDGVQDSRGSRVASEASEEVQARVRTLESQYSSMRIAMAMDDTDPVLQVDMTDLKRSVQDLQLMVFDLRAEAHGSSGKTPKDTAASGEGGSQDAAGRSRLGPHSYPGFAAANSGQATPSVDDNDREEVVGEEQVFSSPGAGGEDEPTAVHVPRLSHDVATFQQLRQLMPSVSGTDQNIQTEAVLAAATAILQRAVSLESRVEVLEALQHRPAEARGLEIRVSAVEATQMLLQQPVEAAGSLVARVEALEEGQQVLQGPILAAESLQARVITLEEGQHLLQQPIVAAVTLESRVDALEESQVIDQQQGQQAMLAAISLGKRVGVVEDSKACGSPQGQNTGMVADMELRLQQLSVLAHQLGVLEGGMVAQGAELAAAVCQVESLQGLVQEVAGQQAWVVQEWPALEVSVKQLGVQQEALQQLFTQQVVAQRGALQQVLTQQLVTEQASLQQRVAGIEQDVKQVVAQQEAHVAWAGPQAEIRAKPEGTQELDQLDRLLQRVTEVEVEVVQARIATNMEAVVQQRTIEQLQQLQQRVAGVEASGAEGPGSSGANDHFQEGALQALAAKVAQLQAAVGSLGETGMAGSGSRDSSQDGALQALASKVAQLESAVGSLGEAGVTQDSEGKGKLQEYGRVLQAMRARIIALQEYLESTQGMVKELHTVHGSVLMRLGVLEEKEVAGVADVGGGVPSAQGGPSEDLRNIQGDLASLEVKFAAFSASQAQLGTALDGLRRMGDRLGELDTRDGEMAAKLAAIGQTMPVIATQLKSLERQLHGRLDSCCVALEALGSTLAEVSRMERQDTKNPFAGIGGAGNNPVVKLLESKVEMLRSALSNVARALSEDMRTARNHQLGDL